MNTKISMNDALLAKASRYTGNREESALIREALLALIQRESAKRLANLGGSEPQMIVARRRRVAI